LIENGSDTTVKNKEGKNALDYAIMNGALRGADAYNLLREKTVDYPTE
jgi:ankyrin repeat protein